AGVNKAALYYHVGNKKALYDALLADARSVLRETFRELLEGRAEPEGRLDVFIKVLAGVVTERRKLWQVVLRGYGEGSGGLSGEMALIVELMLSEFTGIIDDGRSMGVFRRDCDPQVGLSMVLGGVHLLNSGGSMHERKADRGFSFQPQMQRLQPVPVAEEISRSLVAAFRA
ncbi:MAG: TetR/AcrR family transcriptional regulator, partial [Thermodesulfovibrionales bacterium]|nr:TetR/AcrR family transcriptional regulator [Thermodesulfovibrionales bacterium]